MKNIFLACLFFVVAFVLIVGTSENKGRVYDCGMAEWHPDIPKEVKDECRRLHYEEWKKQQDSKKKLITT